MGWVDVRRVIMGIVASQTPTIIGKGLPPNFIETTSSQVAVPRRFSGEIKSGMVTGPSTMNANRLQLIFDISIQYNEKVANTVALDEAIGADAELLAKAISDSANWKRDEGSGIIALSALSSRMGEFKVDRNEEGRKLTFSIEVRYQND